MADTTRWIDTFSEFAGKKILVTGSSQGIGAAVASAFADCGARVAVHYGRNKPKAEALVAQIEAAGGEAVIVGGNLLDAGAGRALVNEAAEALGGLDVVIHNAGDPLLRDSFEDMSDENEARSIQLNQLSAFEIIRAAIPHVRKSDAGSIIVTTSVSVRNGGSAGVSIYGAAKASLESIVRTLAIELIPDGVRINGVAPGYIDTDIHTGFSNEEERESYLVHVPMGRPGKADDCVGTYLFFASQKMSNYITGVTLDVNGGMTLR